MNSRAIFCAVYFVSILNNDSIFWDSQIDNELRKIEHYKHEKKS